MKYNYQALTRAGRIVTGVVEKPSILEAKEDLQKVPLSVLSLSAVFSHPTFHRRKLLKSRTLSEFFSYFGDLLNSGMSIEDSLSAVGSTTSEKLIIGVIKEMKASLKKGYSLTRAIEETEVFPDIVIGTLSAGQKAGTLPQSMNELGEFYDRRDAFGKTVKRAAIYPTIVLTFATIVLILALSFLVPRLKPLFQNLTLPFTTRIVLFISDFFRAFWYIIIAAILGFFVGGKYFLQTEVGNRLIQKFYESSNVGRIFKEITFSAIFLNLSTLYYSGVSLKDAISLVAKTTSHYIAICLGRTKDLLEKGYSFSEALIKQKVFPSFITQTVKRGEELGKSKEYLRRISNFYDDRTKQNLETLSRMVEPALLILVGAIIAFVGLSIILPIYSNMASLAQPR